MKAKRVPGISVAIVCKDEIIYKKGFGVRDVETKTPTKTGDLFRLGSTTKMFVALAAANLAEKGIVDLNAPVGTYAKKLHPKLASLTLNQLLRHTSGLSDDAPQRGLFDETALEKRVLSWDEKAFFTEPDKVFSYSNPGYVLASYVLQKAEGKPFANVMKENVFMPLEMNKSTFRPLMAMTYPFAQGHMRTSGGMKVVRPFAENAANWAPGSMFSNVEEISQYLIKFLNNKELLRKDKNLASALNVIKTPKSNVLAMNRKYGYGLVNFKEKGIDVVMHTGGRVGFGSIIWTVPKHQFGIVILANSTAILTNSARKATALLIPTKSDKKHVPNKPISINQIELNEIIGKYVNSGRIRVELISKDGNLLLKFANREFKVNKIGKNKFQAIGAGPLTNFILTKSSDGTMRYLQAEYWALILVK